MVNSLTRIGDSAQFDVMSSQTQNIKKQVSETNRQMVTGLKAHMLSDIATESRRHLNIAGTINKNSQYIKNIDDTMRRLESMRTQVEQLISMNSEFKARLKGAVGNATVVDTGLNAYAKGRLENLEQILNTTDGSGQNLFGGDRTEGKIVDTALYPAPGSGDPLSQAYYAGNSTKHKITIGDDLYVTYGVTANEPGFNRMIHALKIAATRTPEANPTSTNMTVLREGQDQADSAHNDLVAIQERILTAQKALKQKKESLEELNHFMSQQDSEIMEVDPRETYVKLVQLLNQQSMSMVAMHKVFSTDTLTQLLSR